MYKIYLLAAAVGVLFSACSNDNQNSRQYSNEPCPPGYNCPPPRYQNAPPRRADAGRWEGPGCYRANSWFESEEEFNDWQNQNRERSVSFWNKGKNKQNNNTEGNTQNNAAE